MATIVYESFYFGCDPRLGQTKDYKNGTKCLIPDWLTLKKTKNGTHWFSACHQVIELDVDVDHPLIPECGTAAAAHCSLRRRDKFYNP